MRRNGDIYVSTPQNQVGHGAGIIAFTSMPSTTRIESSILARIDGGTRIRFYQDQLYATTPGSVYRFIFHSDELVPSREPERIVEGMPTSHPGFSLVNGPIAFDGKGSLFVALDGSANLCTTQTLPPPGKP